MARQEHVTVEVNHLEPRGVRGLWLRLVVTVETFFGVSSGSPDDAELVVQGSGGTVVHKETGSYVVLMARAQEMRRDAEMLDESAFEKRWLGD